MGVVTLRTDAETDAALAFLGATPGNRSKVVKEAILALAENRRRIEERREAERLARDPADRAEIAAVQADMDDVSAW